MQRRDVVRSLAVLAVGTGGCSKAAAPTPAPPERRPSLADGSNVTLTANGPLQIEDGYSIAEGPGDNVDLTLSVTNPTERSHRATLRLTTSLGDRETEQTRLIFLERGETREFSFLLVFDYRKWLFGSPSLQVEFDYETTP